MPSDSRIPVDKISKSTEFEPSEVRESEGTVDRLNEAPQDFSAYIHSLESEYHRVMSNDVTARHFYDMTTCIVGLDERHGMMSAIVALSNANKNLRDGRPG